MTTMPTVFFTRKPDEAALQHHHNMRQISELCANTGIQAPPEVIKYFTNNHWTLDSKIEFGPDLKIEGKTKFLRIKSSDISDWVDFIDIYYEGYRD